MRNTPIPIPPAPEVPAEPKRRKSERRRLFDRRSAEDRRSGAERRKSGAKGPSERRSGNQRRASDDRRAATARRHGRRRRETSEQYTAREIEELRRRFVRPGPVECPSCEGAFTMAAGRRRGDQVARRVACLGCGRAAVVPHSLVARVIVVDRVGERREGLRAVLAKAGHEVIETDEAGVALRAYRTTPADVVLLNVAATGRMDASDFLRRLRRDYPEARVVAVGARGSQVGPDPLATLHSLGAVRTLRIPATPEALLKSVDEARR